MERLASRGAGTSLCGSEEHMRGDLATVVDGVEGWLVLACIFGGRERETGDVGLGPIVLFM